MFSTLPKPNFNFSVPFILSSANSFNLNQSEILSFGKELNLPPMTSSVYVCIERIFGKGRNIVLTKKGSLWKQIIFEVRQDYVFCEIFRSPKDMSKRLIELQNSEAIMLSRQGELQSRYVCYCKNWK